MLPRIQSLRATKRSYGHVCAGRRGYSAKVQAFPFALSKQAVIKKLAPAAALLTFSSPLRALLSGLMPQFISPAPPLQPSRLQPVYFPCWFIDAEIEGSVWLRHQGEETRRSTAINLTRSYLPGFPYEPVCRIPLSSPNLGRIPTVPFSPELTTPEGDQVTCLPYTISPLSLLKIAQSLPQERCLIDEDMCFDPTSIKPNLLAAYPVLFPLYIVQYELQEPFASLTTDSTIQIVVEAHSRKGHISIYPTYPSDLPKMFPQEEVIHTGRVHRTFASCDYDPSTSTTASYDTSFPTFQMKIAKWLDGLILNQPGAAAKLAEVSDIPAEEHSQGAEEFWNQYWVRKWDLEDIKANRDYICHPRPDRQKPDWWKDWHI